MAINRLADWFGLHRTRSRRAAAARALSTVLVIAPIVLWLGARAGGQARINVAAAANGATVIASSYSAGYEPSGAINGDRTGRNWGYGNGWTDGTPATFPDWLEVDFAS